MNTPYFPLYVNDFLADYDWLSNEEIGAAIRLVVRAWKDDPVGTLPNDDVILSRYARIDDAKWQEMKPIVMRLFTLGRDDRWYHPQLRAFFEKTRKVSKARSEAAKHKENNCNANAEQLLSKSKAIAQQKQYMSEVRNTPKGGDLKSPSIFDLGVSVLAVNGDDARSMRALVVKKIGEYGEEPVAKALAVTATKEPAGRKEYFLGVLKKERQKGSAPKMVV